QIARGQAGIGVPWEPKALEAAAKATATELGVVASALMARFHADPWALARAAELLLRAESYDAADAAHSRAPDESDDALARRGVGAHRGGARGGRIPRRRSRRRGTRVDERARRLEQRGDEAPRAKHARENLARGREVGRSGSPFRRRRMDRVVDRRSDRRAPST